MKQKKIQPTQTYMIADPLYTYITVDSECTGGGGGGEILRFNNLLNNLH